MTVSDLVAQHKDEYAMRKDPALVTVRAGRYLWATAAGAAGDAEFQAKLGALYGHAYTIKFAKKQAGADTFKVAPLEALWWVAGGGQVFTAPKRSWRWKLLIRVPPSVRPADVRAARAALRAKGRPATGLRRETITEGSSVQMLHIGAYGDEPDTIARIDAFAHDHRLRFRGRHHEIYLSDPRRVPPARLRTILRHAADGSPGSRRAEDVMVSLPFLRALPVRVVSVAPLLPAWYGLTDAAGSAALSGESYQRIIDDERTSHGSMAAEAAARLAARGITTTEAPQGDAAYGIIEAARVAGADLVVVGSRGNTGLERLLLGRVARGILYHAPCSVLIVRPPAATGAAAAVPSGTSRAR